MKTGPSMRTDEGVAPPIVPHPDNLWLPARITSRIVVQPTGCWRWAGSTNSAGYGQVCLDGRKRTVHRAVWEAVNGAIPAGLQVGHRCHDQAAEAGDCAGGVGCLHRCCANPGHLALQTNRENALASPLTKTGDLARRTRCPAGHPLVEGNLRPALARRGRRGCLACIRVQARARHAAVRLACRALRLTRRAFYRLPRDQRLAAVRAAEERLKAAEAAA
jgi:hypothetical protein